MTPPNETPERIDDNRCEFGIIPEIDNQLRMRVNSAIRQLIMSSISEWKL
jgi:hypothetical protein